MEKDTDNNVIEEIINSPDGMISSRSVKLNGEHHNLNGPALILYDKSGEVLYEYYLKHGTLHREDGPAYIYHPKNINPAIINERYFYNGNEIYVKTQEEFELKIKTLCLK